MSYIIIVIYFFYWSLRGVLYCLQYKDGVYLVYMVLECKICCIFSKIDYYYFGYYYYYCSVKYLYLEFIYFN